MEKLEVITIVADLVKIKNEKSINFYNSLIWPLTECYWATSVYINSLIGTNKTNINEMKIFYQEIQWFVENLFEEKVISHYESCSLDTVKNAINSF